MITIQNLSTNDFACVVVDVNGTTNGVTLHGGGTLTPPGVILPSGTRVYGGMLVEGTLAVYDTSGGQAWAMLYGRGQTGYAFDGGVLALSMLGVLYVIRMVRRGVKLREAYE